MVFLPGIAALLSVDFFVSEPILSSFNRTGWQQKKPARLKKVATIIIALKPRNAIHFSCGGRKDLQKSRYSTEKPYALHYSAPGTIIQIFIITTTRPQKKSIDGGDATV